MPRFFVIFVGVLMSLFPLQTWAHAEGEHGLGEGPSVLEELGLVEGDDGEFLGPDEEAPMVFACTQASAQQKALIEQGNRKRSAFLNYCGKVTGGSAWCNQLIRPNPSSIATFRCTYGDQQTHQLIHPDETTWSYAAQAVRLVEQLENEGIRVCLIYNWWRPEPYNRNVGGAAGRHPFGTSVDVRFCSKADQERAFVRLCEWRQAGQLRALGYYSGTALHFGVGDANPNTWGKACPR